MALEYLRLFLERIKGLSRWTDVRTRASWTNTHLYARLGDLRRARLAVKSVHGRHLVDGLTREVVASAVDSLQLDFWQGEPPDKIVERGRKLIKTCIETRPDLTADQRSGLSQMDYQLRRYPETAFRELVAFRKSFPAPVPGRLGERIGKREF